MAAESMKPSRVWKARFHHEPLGGDDPWQELAEELGDTPVSVIESGSGAAQIRTPDGRNFIVFLRELERVDG